MGTLDDLAEACGASREASVSRELSKRFETTYRGTLGTLLAQIPPEDLRGEFVIVVAPAAEGPAPPDFAAQARKLAAEGLAPAALRRALVALGAPRNLAYTLSLEFGGKGG